MERLTKRISENIIELSERANPIQYNGSAQRVHIKHPFWNVFNKLCDYEDAEEQGLLLRLPCKVGDVLWCTDNKKTESFIVKEFKICAYKINRVEIYFENASGFGLCLFDGTLDEGWFLTKEEAEQALARMEKENG